MKILFFSNYFNHHQQPLADALWELTGGDFCFLESETMPEERKLLGYPVLERPYLLHLWEQPSLAEQWLLEADVVITGSAPEAWVRKRIRAGKLVLRYSERPLRREKEYWKYLPRWIRWHWRNPRKAPIYLLCASAYAAGDYAQFGLFRDRAYRWGYFPEAKRYDLGQLMPGKDPSEILWAGRFVTDKHPEAAVEAARRLRDRGISFRMTMIGRGELEQKLKAQVSMYGLEDRVIFTGAMPPEQVRRAMEGSGIFLMTSDRREGWGVVLNEAMNSGCAVIAGNTVGAAPYLLRDGENGIVCPEKDLDAVTEALETLLQNPKQQRRLGEAAYETMTELWSPQCAARRLMALADCLLEGRNAGELYRDGPCSKAPILTKKEGLP